MTQPLRFPWYTLFPVLLLLLPGRVAAQSATLTDDAFLSSNTATQLANANGQGIALVVAGSNATVGPVHVGTTKSFIKFQLQSSLPPLAGAANVVKATLKLFISPSCNPNGAIDIYPVTGMWTESTLNPSAPPTLSSTAFATAMAVGRPNTFLVVDVTHLVQQWLEGSANGGLDNDGIALVADTSSTNVTFDSKENFITSHEPRLEIVLVDSGPQGPAGPQGPQGATGSAGPAGPAGAAGSAAIVNVGTTMTVPAGTPATVLNGGTATNAMLNFLIPQGPTGLTGAQGPQGPVGIANRGAWTSATAYNSNDAVFDSASYWLATAANIGSEPSPTNTNWQLLAGGIVNRGLWTASNSYNVNDAVSDAGSYWLAVTPTSANTATPNTSCEPSAAGCAGNWQLLAAQGLQGQPGAQGQAGSVGPAGAPGAAATVQVGNVTTGAPGSQAVVSNSGSPIAAILNFTIPQGVTGTGAAPSSVLPAFLPGPLTQKYTAASLVPDSAITVTRISAALKTAPDTSCKPTVLRVGNGSTGQDIVLTAGQSGDDSGAMSLPTAAGSTLQLQVQTPASCPQTNPADANVLVEYRGQQSGDAQVCAQSGLACNGVCEETQSDQNNCGACGVVCPISQPCNAGSCGGGCSSGLTACGSTCLNLQTDPSNCGGCGNQCVALPLPNPPVPVCQSGTCQNSLTLCPSGSGLTLCSGACVNTTSDSNNCGACGQVCGGGTTCTNGHCTGGTCSSSQVFCPAAGACVDLQTDPNNCGACGQQCGTCTLPAAPRTCNAGACSVCPV
jgi:hypothetical protein